MKRKTMLTFLCLLVSICMAQSQSSSDYFITTWETTTANESITIPTSGTGYNYDVDWDNDGTFESIGLTGNATHTYATAGLHTVNIRGSFPRIYFANTGDKDKILEVNQWGIQVWTSMNNAFYGCSNLDVTASDSPNLSSVTDMSGMFFSCRVMNSASLNNWNTSNVTNMQDLFNRAVLFNQSLNNWNVSNVTNMGTMFLFAREFNGNISSWDVGNVTSMNSMFHGANVFNQDIGNWDVSNVVNMNYMFTRAWDFNQDIGAWDVSSVTGFFGTFLEAYDFNQDISGWDMSNKTTLYEMFRNAGSFNQDLSAWDVSNVTNMNLTFRAAVSFDQNLGNWDIGSVTTMTDMLNSNGMSRTNYENTLVGWANATNTPSNVSLGAGSKTYCSAASVTARNSLTSTYNWTITGDAFFCQDQYFITTWETTLANESITIPTTGTGYNYDVDWDNDGTFESLGLTGDATHTYATAGIHTVNIRGSFPRIHFANTGDKDKILEVNQWGIQVWTSMKDAFYGCSKLDVTATDSPNLSSVTDMSGMFYSCRVMNSASLNNWNTSNVTNMLNLFNRAVAFNQSLNNWDVSNVTNMGTMFLFAREFNGNISSWDVGNVVAMNSMFHGANVFNQDIGSWDVSSVTNMNYMFTRAWDFNQDIGAWNVSNVTGFSGTFLEAYDFNQDISGWNMSNKTTLYEMFRNAGSFNQDISTWDVGNVTNMNSTFKGAVGFDQNLGGWDIGSVTTMTSMLDSNGMSTTNYENTLIGWANATNTPSNISLGAGSKTYCSAASVTARNSLTSTYNWTITGDTQVTCGKSASISSNDLATIYPNPSNSIVHVNYKGNDLKSLQVILVDLHGKQVLKTVGKTFFNVSNLKNGVYILILKSNSIQKTQKFVKM